MTRLVTLAAVDLLSQEMRQLYGYWWGPIQRGLLAAATNGIVRTAVRKTPYERALPQLREQARVHAFGAKALKINRDLRQASTAGLASADPEEAEAPSTP